MLLNETEKIWHRGKIIAAAFEEYKLCVKDVLDLAGKILHTPVGTPREFEVRLDEIPAEFYSLRRNLFSTLFQSVYQLLGVSYDRRLLYGKLNHLFRIWVTSADNLLDAEDKIVVPIKITGSSRMMRQIISIMLADRVSKNILDRAVQQNVLDENQAKILSEKSLQILLPSAAEEASEEGGVTERPDPDYVLYTIHRLKTGLLFHIPFFGPDHIEKDIDKNSLAVCKQALMNFGLGCQILDDIRDMAKDFLEARHNYVLSRIYSSKPEYISKLTNLEENIEPSSNIFLHFPDAVCPAADKALHLLTNGLLTLDKIGLGIGEDSARRMSSVMFKVLGVEQLTQCLKK